MNPRRNLNSSSPLKTGRFAVLSDQLRTTGSSAPSTGRLPRNAPRLSSLALCAALACLAVLTVGPSAASAKQTRLFAGSFGASTSTVPDPYPVSFGGAVAVDETTHDVYVTDPSNNRVQKFDSGGHFLQMFGAGVLAAGAQGTGDIVAGSARITNVSASGRPFLVGTQIEGAGIPPETLIVNKGIGTLTLSQPAAATASGVSLDVAEGAGNLPTDEEQKVALENSPSGGSFRLTFTAGTASGEISGNLKKVLNTGGASGAFHVGDSSGVLSAEATGDITAGSTTVSNAAIYPGGNNGAFVVGQPIGTFQFGEPIPGIPAGTTIVSVGAGTLTLSQPATATVAGASLRVGTTITAIDFATGSLTLSANATRELGTSITATETTAPIPYNASSGQVSEALEALPAIGAGGVAVSGGAGGPWTIEFNGPHLADSDVPTLSIDSSTLAPASANAAVTTTLQGHSSPEICLAHCQPGAASNLPGGLNGPNYLAVDNDPSSPSHGDLYVADGNLISKFDPEGHLVETWGNGGPLGAPNGQLGLTPPEPVGTINGIAVDHSGNLWVYAPRQMFEFSPSGVFIAGWKKETGEGETKGIALDSEDNVFFTTEHVSKFSSTGTAIGQNIVEYKSNTNGYPPTPQALAVDSQTNDLYVGFLYAPGEAPRENFVSRYDSTCHPKLGILSEEDVNCKPVEKIGADTISTGPTGLAIDSNSSERTLYVAAEREEQRGPAQVFTFSEVTVPDVTTTKPANPTASSATLTGTVNPGGIELNPGTEGCRFEWGETTTPYEHQAPCDKTAAQLGSGNAPVAVKAEITGLQAGHTYHYRLVASNPNDENASVHQPSLGADLAFGPPKVESASALDVSATEAELQAGVNPQNVDTQARIEYVTQAQFEASGFAAALSTPATDIGSAGTVQSPTFQISGLQPRTAYRYRVIAENALAQGPEAMIGPEPPPAFTTQGPAPAGLPDSRQYQLVSPPDKRGAKIRPIIAGVIQAAADGRAITYLSNGAVESQPQGAGAFVSQVFSTRAPSGWLSQVLDTPHLSRTDPTDDGEYRAFSEDLAYSFLNPHGFDPAISPEASDATAFRRADFIGNDPAQQCLAATMYCYRPLVTGAPGPANVLPGTPFGSASNEGTTGPSFVYSTPDGSHAVIRSIVALTETPLPAGQAGLYEWSAAEPPASQLQLVNLASGTGQPVKGSFFGFDETAMRNVLSADGSRVFFTGTSGVGTGLFLRDTARGETIQLDLREPGCAECESGSGRFQLASADGSRVLFTDKQRLTSDSGATETADLYQCKIVESEATGQLECELTDLTPKTSGGEAAAVQGAVIGASSDASSVYFVADGALTEEPNDQGEVAQPGSCNKDNGKGASTCNLYLSREGQLDFIATLSGEDRFDWIGSLRVMTARVSPNGQWLAFMSARSLTGYDNRDRSTGEPAAEVYLYHAPPSGQGTLLCPSCEPSGARPRGVALEAGVKGSPDASYGFEYLTLVAANLPGWNGMQGVGRVTRRQPRYLSDVGRLFFTTVDPLLPSDANGTQDVYEYQPAGVAGCSETLAGFNRAAAGCLGLVSSGTSSKESTFLDASESGDDVFFLTSERLAPTDVDAAADVYDAHVCTGEVPCLPPPAPPKPPCVGDGCQPPATPPNDPTPGSLTFNGAGSLTECPKGKVKKSGKCVTRKAKKHHKKKGHKKQKRANTNRGGQK